MLGSALTLLPARVMKGVCASIYHTRALGKELMRQLGGTGAMLCPVPSSMPTPFPPLSRTHKLLCRAGFISGMVIKTPVNHI